MPTEHNTEFTFKEGEDEPLIVIVCAALFGAEQTLCGNLLAWREMPTAVSGKTMNKPVDCEKCIAVIDFCQSIKPSKIKRK